MFLVNLDVVNVVSFLVAIAPTDMTVAAIKVHLGHHLVFSSRINAHNAVGINLKRVILSTDLH